MEKDTIKKAYLAEKNKLMLILLHSQKISNNLVIC
jgi:hypothetical protein